MFNNDSKFDIDLAQANKDEESLANVLCNGKIELKTEHSHWYKTGNICVEIECSGKPSGIYATEADWWVIELKNRTLQTMSYIVLPVSLIKQITEEQMKTYPLSVKPMGDGQRVRGVLVPLSSLVTKYFQKYHGLPID